MKQTNTPTMKPIMFKTRQVADDRFEVIMYGCYPQVVAIYPTKAKAEEVAEKANAINL